MFISQIWDFIKGMFPCLPSFVHVFADDDIMYATNYPFHRAETGDLHCVETVLDFFNFASRLVEKMYMRLTKTSEPVVSDDLSAATLGKLLLPGVAVAQEVFRPGKYKPLSHTDPEIERFKQIGTDAQKRLRDKHHQLSVEVDKNKPQLPEYYSGLKIINQLDKAGKDITDSVVFSMIPNILRGHASTIHAEIHGGRKVPFDSNLPLMETWKCSIHRTKQLQ